MKKYRLSQETVNVDDIKLYRIIALRDFGDVKAGDLGGFIQDEYCLSHEGDCWIYRDVTSEVLNGRLRGSSVVMGFSSISGNSIVKPVSFIKNCKLSGKVTVKGSVLIDVDVNGKAKFNRCRILDMDQPINSDNHYQDIDCESLIDLELKRIYGGGN